MDFYCQDWAGQEHRTIHLILDIMGVVVILSAKSKPNLYEYGLQTARHSDRTANNMPTTNEIRSSGNTTKQLTIEI